MPVDGEPSFRKQAVPDDAAAGAEQLLLYVEPDEEIPSIIDRVRSAASSRVVLVVPKRALFMESLVNVKLLQREADVSGKVLSLISSDRKALHLAAQVGIAASSEMPKGAAAPADDAADKPLRRAAAKATVGSLAASTPQRSRLTLRELLAARRAKPVSELRSLDPKEPLPQLAFSQGSPNRRLFMFFLALCLVALVIVGYFVLPKATVAIVMESKVESITDRVVLADAGSNAADLAVKNTKFVPTQPVSIEKEMTKTYAATGIVSSGTNAQGLMTIINDAGSNQQLIAATRFRSPDGIIYRLQAGVVVPARASVRALVVADPVDEGGRLVGDRGNLAAGTKFSIPALTGANRSLVYGKNDQALTGGVTKATRVVTQADLDAARKDLIQTLRDGASQQLDQELQARLEKGSSFVLLNNPGLLDVSTLSFSIQDGVAAKSAVDQFRATAKVRVEGVAYDRNAVQSILDRKISEVIHPDQKAQTRDLAGLRVDVVEPRDAREERAGRIKVNATMKVRFEYQMSEELTATIKKRVLGDTVADAQHYVQGLEQVANVRVTTWPFWVRRIPNISSSLEVQVVPSIAQD